MGDLRARSIASARFAGTVPASGALPAERLEPAQAGRYLAATWLTVASTYQIFDKAERLELVSRQDEEHRKLLLG